MPKYSCPTCQTTYDDLFDVSICIGNHNMQQTDEVIHEESVAIIAKPRPLPPSRVEHKIDFVSLPNGVCEGYDLKTLALYRDKIVSEFFVDMPWKIPLKWSRRNASSLGVISWSSSPFGVAEVFRCSDTARGPGNNKRWRMKAFFQIKMQPGRPWLETLCTLAHELLHAYDYYLHGIWGKSWSESHLGYFDARKNSINTEFKAIGSKINIAVKGGDRQMDGETETWLRNNLEKGSHISWEWQDSKGKPVTGLGIVKRRNSHMVSIDAYNVEPRTFKNIDKIPWQKIKQIDGFDVSDWMNGIIP